MLIKYYSVQENKTPCHTPLSPSGPFSYVWKGVKCYIDTNILSASTHTPMELKTMFKDQLALLSQELKTFHQYKLLTQKATKSIEEQYEHLFFYQGYTYQKAQLLQETHVESAHPEANGVPNGTAWVLSARREGVRE